jgi:large subunit ribosomal protein L25
MAQRELTVQSRDGIGKEAAKVMRRAGQLPAVLYGHGQQPVTLGVNAREFGDLIHHHGVHSLIVLRGDGHDETAIIKAVQRHPYRGVPTTVDFLRVSADEKITVTLPLILEGEPIDVKSGAGVLVQSLHEVELRTLSGEVPESIHVDISSLVLNGPPIHVSDIVIPSGAEMITPGDEAVAVINGPQAATREDIEAEAELEAAAEAGAAATAAAAAAES